MAPDLFEPPAGAVRDAVTRALAEDLTPLGDLSSVLVPAEATTVARVVSRGQGRLAGVACATETFAQIDADLDVEWHRRDGADLSPGTVIGEVRGSLASVLVAERTALNFLGHLSGIATRVHQLVALAGDRVKVWDTRKTTPGLRSLEKAAVRAGGGYNHRGNLSDWVMIKDNHLTGLSIADAVSTARDRWPGRSIQVECDRHDQLLEAIAAAADLVLLDNMTPDQVAACVAAAAEAAAEGRPRPLLEASGGITVDTVADYARTGVDLVSSGSLTNSAPVLDIGLDIAEPGPS